MRWLLFLVIAAMGMFKGHSQALVQTYTDRCTGEVKVFSVDINGSTVVSFYNKSRVFTAAEFTNGTLQAWLEETYQWWQALSPCSTGQANTTTTQQTTTNATSNATNAANNATSNATNNTGTTNTNTNGNTGSTNTGSTGSSSSGSGSTSGSSSSGSTGSDSGGTSSGSSDSSGGDTGGSTNNDSSGQDSSGSSDSDSNSNSSDTDNSSGNGDSSDDSSSGGSGDDQSNETEEGSSNESSDESSNEENKESDSSESEESENKESEESESEEEVEEEKKEEESEEEKKEETTEEEEEEEQEEKKLAPPIISANLVSMSMIDGMITQAASFGYSQSSLTGEDTYSANAMVWSNLKQYSINLSKSHVFFNYDKEVPVFIIDPDTKKAHQFGSYKDRGSIMYVQSLSVGYMRMFSTHIATWGISNVYLGQKDNFWKGFVGGFAVNGMGIFLEGGEIIGTAALTLFGTKPFNIKNRLTISPMLAYSASPASYSAKAKEFTLTPHGTYIIGSNFDFTLSKRFKANLGGNIIGNTQPDIPLSWAITIGSRFQF